MQSYCQAPKTFNLTSLSSLSQFLLLDDGTNLISEFLFFECTLFCRNPLLKHIRNVKWIFSDINPDYLLGQTTCALCLR